MKKTGLLVALATGVFLSAAASAPAQRFGLGYGGGRFGRRAYSGFGFGLGFGGFGYPRTTVRYQNAFTGDVAYAERAVNDFRASYERRKGDPLGIKSRVQRLDETMERLRREAERYGGPTDRGSDLVREALDLEDRIDRRLRDERDDPSLRDWDDVRRILDRLAGAYRAG